jgi:hypothetical protein
LLRVQLHFKCFLLGEIGLHGSDWNDIQCLEPRQKTLLDAAATQFITPNFLAAYKGELRDRDWRKEGAFWGYLNQELQEPEVM